MPYTNKAASGVKRNLWSKVILQLTSANETVIFLTDEETNQGGSKTRDVDARQKRRQIAQSKEVSSAQAECWSATTRRT